MNEPLPGPPLRIAVLADFEGPHTHRWVRVFVERGHDVHAISYYPVASPPPGVTLHVLDPGRRATDRARARRALRLLQTAGRGHLAAVRHASRPRQALHARRAAPRSAMTSGPTSFTRTTWSNMATTARRPTYTLSSSAPGGRTSTRRRGRRSGRWIAHRVLRKADLVSCNDPELREEALKLGARFGDTIVTRLGVDEVFFDGPHLSVNMESGASARPVVISDRALEPLYNVDTIIRAFAQVRAEIHDARLVIANDGSQRRRLESLARELHLEDAVQLRRAPGAGGAA